jgi:hypothetical protein
MFAKNTVLSTFLSTIFQIRCFYVIFLFSDLLPLFILILYILYFILLLFLFTNLYIFKFKYFYIFISLKSAFFKCFILIHINILQYYPYIFISHLYSLLFQLYFIHYLYLQFIYQWIPSTWNWKLNSKLYPKKRNYPLRSLKTLEIREFPFENSFTTPINQFSLMKIAVNLKMLNVT